MYETTLASPMHEMATSVHVRPPGVYTYPRTGSRCPHAQSAAPADGIALARTRYLHAKAKRRRIEAQIGAAKALESPPPRSADGAFASRVLWNSAHAYRLALLDHNARAAAESERQETAAMLRRR